MISTLAGPNEYLINLELKNRISKFSEVHGNLAIEQIDGTETDLQYIGDSVSNLSFLSPNRLIILKRGSENKQLQDSIEKILDLVPDTNEIIIVEPNIDKRLSYYKYLKKSTDFKEFINLDNNELTNWITKYVNEKDGKISPSDARYLIEIAGNNQLRLYNELNKLISYKSTISKDSINLLVEPMPQSTIFQLLEAAFVGDNKKLLKIYEDQKMQKVEPQQIIALLTWQIHILALINAAGTKSSNEIASETKVSPYVISKSMNIAKKLSKNDIQKLTSSLLELDIKLKNKTVDADDALLQLLFSIKS